MGDENNNSLALFAEDRFEPCRVCGEPSSGWHCGAVTCEACKKFFLRSINGEDAKYKCLRNQDCVIVRTTRTQCQYCRFQKCKEVGMTNNDNPSNPTVAELFKGFPCSVCKAPSSGVHFGAITCEGCKGFFRRSIKERAPERYRCMETGNCEISVATRNMCRHCRFQRCIKAGMSAQNSRIGRQSNLFKHHIIEWQSRGVIPNSDYLVTQRKMKRVKSDVTYTPSTPQMNPASDYELSQLMPMNQSNMQNNLNAQANQHLMPINQSFTTNNNDYTMASCDEYGNSFNMNYNNNQMNNQFMNNNYYAWSGGGTVNNQLPNTSHMNQAAISVSTSQHKPIVQQSTSTTSIEDSLEDSIKYSIKVIHQSYTEYLSSIVENMNEDLKRSSHFNSLSHQNNNYHVYQNNQNGGLLSSNQLNNGVASNCAVGSFEEIMKYFGFYARKFVRFSQNIPGLSKLSIDDKEELVKCSIHSVILLSIQRKCDHYNYFNCDQYKLENFLKRMPRFQFTSYFMKTIHEKFEKFKLDEKEYGLYSALLVISTASKNLKDYDKIMEIRENIGTALRKYMFARRNEEITCDEILLMLVHFRKSNMILQNEMVSFYNQIIESNMNAFKDYQFFFKVFISNTHAKMIHSPT